MARDLGVTERRATIAAAVVIFNPITWFDSVVWGQVDSFGTVFLLLAVRELWRGRSERSAILAVVAALIKPQLAILVPIVAVVTIRRALWPAGGWGDEDAPAPSGSRVGASRGRPAPDPDDGRRRAPDGRRDRRAVRALGGLVLHHGAVPGLDRSCASCSAPRRSTPTCP